MEAFEQPIPPREYTKRETGCSRLLFTVGPWETLREVEEETAIGSKDLSKKQLGVHSSPSTALTHC